MTHHMRADFLIYLYIKQNIQNLIKIIDTSQNPLETLIFQELR